ncbi:DUF6069 domain-containing protein [Occultella aeris]|uniref:Uncharacterized protein n=1 Tax=Occultella aeris TaxID=2761496 RepID=A0A7M4DE21_9MICO|nr:DUF6069 family protein [Occultella aeris]VZO35135.1 hypothetical protein HALOF300_00361 [Occultella aeris]
MTNTTSTPATTTSTRATMSTPARRLRRTLAVGGAVAVGVGVWLIAVPVLGADLSVTMAEGTTQIGLGSVIVACVVAGLAGWGSLAVLERLTTGAAKIWALLAVAVTVVSLFGPVGQATSLEAALALGAMHLGVGAALIGLLPVRGAGRAAGGDR